MAADPDGELFLQSRSSSGEDYDEDDLQSPPSRVMRPTSAIEKGVSSCKRRVNDILKDKKRAIDGEEEFDNSSITATTESSHKKAEKVS